METNKSQPQKVANSMIPFKYNFWNNKIMDMETSDRQGLESRKEVQGGGGCGYEGVNLFFSR